MESVKQLWPVILAIIFICIVLGSVLISIVEVR